MMAKSCNCNPPLPLWQRRDWECQHGQTWHVERVRGRTDGGVAIATPVGGATRTGKKR